MRVCFLLWFLSGFMDVRWWTSEMMTSHWMISTCVSCVCVYVCVTLCSLGSEGSLASELRPTLTILRNSSSAKASVSPSTSPSAERLLSTTSSAIWHTDRRRQRDISTVGFRVAPHTKLNTNKCNFKFLFIETVLTFVLNSCHRTSSCLSVCSVWTD